tara:strand:+ start:331 stop:1227 length:897 start_codon:yes stop_codon:yes gene_type:complete
MKTIIITGSDSNYFNHLITLCDSLKIHKVLNDIDLGILDAGLNNDQKKTISKYTNIFVEPEWNFKKNFKAENWKKLLTVRPYLQNYFPGYENYIWMDADMIPLSNNFINVIIQVFQNHEKEICVCNENDNSYINSNKDKSFQKLFGKIYKMSGWVYKNNYKYFGSKEADRLLGKPLINAGFFALKSKSIIWEEWKEIYGNIVESNNDEYCLSMDQSSLNITSYNNIDKVSFLDCKFNWLNKNCLPIIKNNKFCKPTFPYDEIEIMHNTSFDIDKENLFYDFKSQKKINNSLRKLLNKN